MTNIEAIKILSEVIPKGSPDFERLYKLYDYVTGDKKLAIDIFNSKWKDYNIEALEIVIKMYLEEYEYLSSFELFLDRKLENYIQVKQMKLEENEQIGA